jgi:hypothetical protein
MAAWGPLLPLVRMIASGEGHADAGSTPDDGLHGRAGKSPGSGQGSPKKPHPAGQN